MIRLSDATPEDAPALAAILREWIDATDWMPKVHGPDEDEGFLRHLIATRVVRVATLDGAPAGFLARQGGEVDALYVAARHRGRGIGAALIDEAKGEGALTLWTFQANTRAIAFYRRQGFTEGQRTDGSRNEERLPDLRLDWRAAP